jgi:hypothetical protein
MFIVHGLQLAVECAIHLCVFLAYNVVAAQPLGSKDCSNIVHFVGYPSRAWRTSPHIVSQLLSDCGVQGKPSSERVVYSDLDKLCMTNVSPKSQRLWAHAISVYVVTFIILKVRR